MSTPEIRGIVAPTLFRLMAGNWQQSTLLLLMFCIRADDPHDAFSADDLAVFADSPHACSNLHDNLNSCLWSGKPELVFVSQIGRFFNNSALEPPGLSPIRQD